jgi:vesicle transport through interaction with t-SNAREs protein 1
MKNTSTLQRASDSVYRAQQVSADTDVIASNIMEELGEQRQTLVRTRNRVQGFDAQMNQTRSLMRKIACHSIQNRFILIGVILVELIILGFVVWFRFLRGSNNNN